MNILFKKINKDIEYIMKNDLVVRFKIEVFLFYLLVYVMIMYRMVYVFYKKKKFFIVRLIF